MAEAYRLASDFPIWQRAASRASAENFARIVRLRDAAEYMGDEFTIL
jgi:hypothetical protein